MQPVKIVVVGGYGGVGRPLCRRILEETRADVVVAGRDGDRAAELADGLARRGPAGRVSATTVDATDPSGLRRALDGARIVVVAAPVHAHAADIARAALEAGADYVDCYFDPSSQALLEPLRDAAAGAGRCLVTQAGFHPGLPAAYLRHGGALLDRIESARIAFAMGMRGVRPDQTAEILDTLRDWHPKIFAGGEWRAATVRDAVRVDFGSRFGTKRCYPMELAELRGLPERFGLRDAGIFAAGFNPFVDWVVFPLVSAAWAIRPGWGRAAFSRMFAWGLDRFSRGPGGVSFVLEARGERRGQPWRVHITSEHEDPYEFTAIPVVSCLAAMLDGSARRPGLHLMGHLVDPGRLLADMTRMGVSHRIEEGPLPGPRGDS